jgi:hypothetical protein
MKKVKLIWMLATFTLAIGALISISSCGGKKTVKPDVAGLLKSGTWKVGTVTVNGANQISLFTGLTVTFAASSFNSANGDPVWPATGTWTLNPEGTIITRGDGLTVNIDNISQTALGLSLTWNKTTLGGGRSGSVAGNHVFTFGK